MRFLSIYKTKETGVPPTPEEMARMGQLIEEMMKAGVLLSTEGCLPSANGARIRLSGGKLTVTDGPFTETKELIAGFWLWKVKSMEEAVAWVKRCPNPQNEAGEIEIRQVFEFEDFAPRDPTGELRAAEARLREQLERQR